MKNFMEYTSSGKDVRALGHKKFPSITKIKNPPLHCILNKFNPFYTIIIYLSYILILYFHLGL